MIKAKRALISMIVVTTVFCLTMIFNIQLPVLTNRGNSSGKEAAVSTKSDAYVDDTSEGTIQSFSYSPELTGAAITDQGLASEEVQGTQTDTTTGQDSSITANTDSAGTTSKQTDGASEEQTQTLTTSTETETADATGTGTTAADTTTTGTTAADTTTTGTTTADTTTEGTTAAGTTAADTTTAGTTAEDTAAADTTAADSATADQNKTATDNTTDTSVTNTDKTTASAEDTAVKEPEAQYADIGISVAKDYVNIRDKASTDADVLGKLYRGSAATIIETKGDWYYIESGSVKGYVKSDFIKTGIPDEELVKKYGTQTAIVDVDGLNVRKEPSTDAKKLTVIYQNEKYTVVKLNGDWVELKIEDENVSGYVKKEFVEFIVSFKEAVSKEEEQKLLQLQAEERAKKETEIKYSNGVSYTEEDVKLLACLIHSEAGTQSYEGKLAVANVVLNRVKSSKYPDSIKAVIYQSGQFTVAKSGSLQKQLDNYDHYCSNSQLMSIKAARAALEGANNIGDRMYFHSYKAAAKKGYTSISDSVKIGDHLFW